jgi:ABC-type glutathione transport system ATPase component
MLGADDVLVHRPARVLVAGTSGAGKSTLARRIAERLDLPYLEMDALFHGPDWTPRAQFHDEVGEWAESVAWVTEWQYAVARERLADRDHVVRWAWRTHGESPARIAECLTRRPALPVVQLRSAAEVDAWVDGPLSACAGARDGNI